MTRYQSNGEGWYLLTYSTNINVTLKRSQSLTDDWDTAEERVVFIPDPDSGLPYATDVCSPKKENRVSRTDEN